MLSKGHLALALFVLFIVFIVPTFFIVGSAVEYMGFILAFCLISVDYNIIKTVMITVAVYINPLKIVDGRYGMSGAWIGAAPIGFMVASWISATLCSFLNNSVVCFNNV